MDGVVICYSIISKNNDFTLLVRLDLGLEIQTQINNIVTNIQDILLYIFHMEDHESDTM